MHLLRSKMVDEPIHLNDILTLPGDKKTILSDNRELLKTRGGTKEILGRTRALRQFNQDILHPVISTIPKTTDRRFAIYVATRQDQIYVKDVM